MSRPVRRRYKEDGKVKNWTEYEDHEFILTKESVKILKPVFSNMPFDYDVKEEKGTITFVLTPCPDKKPTKPINQEVKDSLNQKTV